MASSGTFAVKLHVADLWKSAASGTGTSSELHVFGSKFQRVWIQVRPPTHTGSTSVTHTLASWMCHRVHTCCLDSGRVVQGHVTRTQGSVFMLSEGDCTVAVKRTSAVVDMWDNVTEGMVVMVIGKFTVKKDSRLVSAHKVCLSASTLAHHTYTCCTQPFAALHPPYPQQPAGALLLPAATQPAPCIVQVTE
jgi:hypothetical protein